MRKNQQQTWTSSFSIFNQTYEWINDIFLGPQPRVIFHLVPSLVLYQCDRIKYQMRLLQQQFFSLSLSLSYAPSSLYSLCFIDRSYYIIRKRLLSNVSHCTFTSVTLLRGKKKRVNSLFPDFLFVTHMQTQDWHPLKEAYDAIPPWQSLSLESASILFSSRFTLQSQSRTSNYEACRMKDSVKSTILCFFRLLNCIWRWRRRCCRQHRAQYYDEMIFQVSDNKWITRATNNNITRRMKKLP